LTRADLNRADLTRGFDMKKLIAPMLFALMSTAVLAKIPAPVLTDEAKAKAAEAAAKTAWSGKVDSYLLCKYQEKAAANYVKTAASIGKITKPATATPACAEVGPFVYPPVTGVAPVAAPVAPAKKS
jgi:hypothetical protein